MKHPPDVLTRLVWLLTAALSLGAGCSNERPADPTEGTLAVVLADGSELASVDWRITGGALTDDLTGTIDVGDEGDTISTRINGIPVAPGYTVELVGVTNQGAQCAGSADFDIPEAGAVALASVTLNCGSGDDRSDGDVVVEGEVNRCPTVSMVVSPLSVATGNTIDLAASADDPNGHPLTFAWSASAGSIDAPAAAATFYTCETVGDVAVQLVVDDGYDCNVTRVAQISCTENAGDSDCSGHGDVGPSGCECDEGYQQDPSDPNACVPASAVVGERLVVADTAAARIYVFDSETWDLLAEFENVAMDDHAGFLQLEDGRLVFADAASETLRIANIASQETPSLGTSVPVRGAIVHLAMDLEQNYLVVSSSLPLEDHSPAGNVAFTIISLADLTSFEVVLPGGEPGVALGGDPLHLFHRNDTPAQFEMYRLSDLMAGTIEAVDTAPLGSFPHGEVIAHSRGKIVSAAGDGVNVIPFDTTGFGPVTAVPYDVDGMAGGRAFYARLSGDGRYLYSYLRDSGPAGTSWAGWRSDAYIVDLETDDARRIPIGNGLVYRLGACENMAAFTQYHPSGDFVHLMDAEQGSPTFQEFVMSVPLEAMSATPDADGSPWTSVAFRITALSTDCENAFVTHGGDGRVSVVDTQTGAIERMLYVPTPLDYGGYVVSVKAEERTSDTIGR